MKSQVRLCTVFCLVFLLLLAFVRTASAEVYTINNETDTNGFQVIVSNMTDGDTLVLDPGIYWVNGIMFSSDITIEANPALGGDRTNTIIEWMSGHPQGEMGIFYSNSEFNDLSLTINNLTLRNRREGGSGGALISANPRSAFQFTTLSSVAGSVSARTTPKVREDR